MSVDDNWGEAIRKATDQFNGSQSDYVFKTKDAFSGWLSQVLTRKVDVTYPDSVTEVYTFSQNAVTQFVITVTYTDSTKSDLLSAERTG